jgi:hypothetical protein
MTVGRNAGALAVSLPQQGSFGSGVVRVRAVAKNMRTFYRMDAELSPGVVLNWPVEDVLRPSGLCPDGFGVYGWVDHPNEGRVFFPLQVDAVGAPAPPSTTILLLVRTSVHLDHLEWRTYTPEALAAPRRWSSGRPLAAGETFEIRLPAAAPSSIAYRRVDIAGRTNNTWHPVLVVKLPG